MGIGDVFSPRWVVIADFPKAKNAIATRTDCFPKSVVVFFKCLVIFTYNSNYYFIRDNKIIIVSILFYYYENEKKKV